MRKGLSMMDLFQSFSMVGWNVMLNEVEWVSTLILPSTVSIVARDVYN